jgi:hypothetical protein
MLIKNELIKDGGLRQKQLESTHNSCLLFQIHYIEFRKKKMYTLYTQDFLKFSILIFAVLAFM